MWGRNELKDVKVLKSLLKPRAKGEAQKTVLRVTVNRATNLPAMDPTGFSDPFCKLRYDGKQQKTNIVKQDLNPEWQESFDFEYKPELPLRIDVYDWDRVGTNDFMGAVHINMSTVSHVYTENWHPLVDEKGNQVPFASILIGVQQMTEAEAGIAPAGKNVSLMSAVVGNLKPILNNIFRLLYVLVRPIMMQLIVVRKLFIDWEHPMSTMVASGVFLYVWYHELILSTLLLMVWWAQTKRLWYYRFFANRYEAIDPNLKEKDLLKEYKDTKIELKYGKDDPISEDVQLVARVTGNISRIVLRVQSFFNWQEAVGPTLATWIIVLLLSLFHSYIPWRLIFYWIFRVAILLGWIVATIVVPLLRVFPTFTIRLRRFFTQRGFLSHIKPKYTTGIGVDTHKNLRKEDLQAIQALGASEIVRANRQITERGEWSDLFFYPVTAVLRSGHTSHVDTFVSPINILLGRFAAFNPGFDLYSYCQAHLLPISTMEGGRLIVFDVNSIHVVFQDSPNLACRFYRWLAFQLTRRNDQHIIMSNTMMAAEDGEEELADSSRLPSDQLLARRGRERTKQMLVSLHQKFGVPEDEGVLHIAFDVYRKHRGRRFYGCLFVTLRHLAFLPATGAQQSDRWICEAFEVETAFVDRSGSLEIRFASGDVSHLHHEDRSVLMDVVNHINHMKSANAHLALTSNVSQSMDRMIHTPENSPPTMKKHNIRTTLSKSLSRIGRSGSFRASRQSLSVVRTMLPGSASPARQASKSPLEGSMSGAGLMHDSNRNNSNNNSNNNSTDGSTTPLQRSRASTPAKEEVPPLHAASGEEGDQVSIDSDDEVANEPAVIQEDEVGRGDTLVSEGAPETWRHVRISDIIHVTNLQRLLDPRMRRDFAAGSTIVAQDTAREVAIQVLWRGKAKAVVKSTGKPDLELGFINEGSIFGETAYLLESNSAASVVAISDCVVYHLPGPWLDGLFEMDTGLGAQFFEALCLVMFERNVLTEELISAARKTRSDTAKLEPLRSNK